MTEFSYTAVAADGRRVRGRSSAADLDELEARLRRMQLDLVAGRPVRGMIPRRQKLSRRDLIVLLFHLEQLMQAGVPLADALAGLRDGGAHGQLRGVAADLADGVNGGLPLSAAMTDRKGMFDGVVVSLVRAGERAGRLPEILRELVEALQWEDECVAQTRRILLYPACAAIVVGAAALFLMLHLVPQLRPFVLAAGAPQSLPTQALFAVSALLQEHWPSLLAALPAALAGAILAGHVDPRLRRRFDAFRLRLPVIGEVLRKHALARFARTFALLYAAGIPVIDALRETQAVAGNRAIEDGLRSVELAVDEGATLTQAFATSGLFPPLALRMLQTGEGSGDIDAALAKIARFYSRDVRDAVGRMHAVIEPALTLLLGGLLAWIALAVLGPVYDMIAGIGP